MNHKNRYSLLVLLFVACALLVGCKKQVNASDYKSTRSPIFEGVERVYVYVKSNGAQSAEAQEKLPDSLRRENLENLLIKLFTERFSSQDCDKRLKGKNPYSCDDQPVILLSDQEYKTWLDSRSKMRRQPGTLNILFQITIFNSTEGIYAKHPQAAFYLVRDRADPEIPTEWEIAFPYSVPLDMENSRIEKVLFDYIDNRIH